MNKKQTGVILFALAILTILMRLPSLDEPLDNDGGAVAYHARQLLRGEELYGRFHPTHHLPAIYYTFELAFELFGDNQRAPKILLLFWVMACAWLLYLLGCSDTDQLTGLLAAVFFILVSCQVLLAGTMAKIESFANLPLTGGTALIIHLLRKQVRPWQYIWIGLLGALCVLYKVIFVTPLILTGVAILSMVWLERGQINSWKTSLARLSWLTVGLVVPLTFVGGYYVSLGLWDRLLLVFTLGFGYMNDLNHITVSSLPGPFGFPVFWMSANNIVLMVLGLIGVYRLTRRVIPLRDINNLIALICVIWFVVSFALAGIRGGGYPYYVLLVVPPLAYIGAFEISDSFRRWKALSTAKLAGLGAGFLATLVMLNFTWINLDLYSHYISYKLGKISYKDFLYGYKGTGPRSWSAQVIADYVVDRTSPNDHVFLWSTDVQFYYFADREPPIDILWPTYVSATGPPERIFSQQTKYIIVDLPERLERPDWLTTGLITDYFLEAALEGKEIYRRKSN